MMNINIMLAKQLYSIGFSFHHYQQNQHKGMIYYYNDSEWVIGGEIGSIMSNFDLEIINNGIWLPSEEHLIEWLKDNDFVFAIINQDGFFELQCKDSVTCTEYHTKVPTLDLALVTVIKKILKKKEREFDTKEKIYGTIE